MLPPRARTLAFTLLSCGMLAGWGGHAAVADVQSAAPDASGPRIAHVVIIYQENHTFDDVLGTVCQTREVPCDGYTGPVTFADGVTAQNIVQPDIVPVVAHDPLSQSFALANKWDQIRGCTEPPYSCISHVDTGNISNLAALADTFTVSDATFASGEASSFGAHLNLAAGTMDGFLGWNPVASKTGEPPLAGWGCPSHRDARWGDSDDPIEVPSCVPDSHRRGPYRTSPVPYTATIMERVEAAGLTWHIYQGASDDAPVNSNWSICTYFNWCYSHRFNRSFDSSFADFRTAAAEGALPSVSIILPDSVTAQHNGNSMRLGDNFIGSIVGALERSPQWHSSAAFITYDDCGCFYDHVKPPPGQGPRNPMVIVSPWAKPTFTDSTVAQQPYSMLAFIQHTFDLDPLTSDVTDAYDYANAFDFGQRPVAGPMMTTTPISASERARLARLLPTIEDDPT
jgi:phospholipase C